MEKKYQLIFKGKSFGCAITAADVKKIIIKPAVKQALIDKVLIDFTKSMAKQMAKG